MDININTNAELKEPQMPHRPTKSGVVFIIIAVLVLVLGIFWLGMGEKDTAERIATPTATPTVTPFSGDSELNAVDKDIQEIDLGDLDYEFQQIDQELQVL